ncbi:hypothetical protein BJ138DRAFT_1065179 [Hygrophoropsis aurantiaca]|uniref:Uncharacterized protein n=1 Tax=Hygrophoropsis aurantiaca TaxID=72124 RepID=A0ACB8AAD0_9AGAM|nr:hypothetical protein BJ138DRAFT_1065179 [Hygrophoropsis aurantiaca]
MSIADLGKYDVSEQTQAMKEKLSSQDTENAGLRSLLMKRDAELQDIKISMNETLHKLSVEADRALRLETSLSQRSEELKTERTNSHNAESALLAAQEKLQTEQRAARDLEAMLDTLSRNSDTINDQYAKVEREKRTLETRVRELETNLHHMSQTVPQIPRRAGRPRSSSASNLQVPVLEHELNDVKASLLQKDQRLRTTEDKLAQIQASFTQVENARIAADKLAQQRINELIANLEDKEEELKELKVTQGRDCSADREQELMERIEEDEAKIRALEAMLQRSADRPQAELDKVENRLRSEIEKVTLAEAQKLVLIREKEAALEESKESRKEVERLANALRHHEVSNIDKPCDTTMKDGTRTSQLQSSSQAYPLHHDERAPAEYIEVLLSAVERLRGERSDLKRALDFSETESRVIREGLSAELLTTRQQLIEIQRNVSLRNEVTQAKHQQSKQLQTTSAVFAITIGYLQSQILSLEHEILEAITSAKDLPSGESLRSREDEQASLQQLEELRTELGDTTQRLVRSEQQREELMTQITGLESDVCVLRNDVVLGTAAHKETRESLDRAEAQIAALSKSYQIIESERNSLNLQVNHLQSELTQAQDALSEAQYRIGSLQAQQLSSLSTAEVSLALREQIQELEDRVVRRTEQIGIHQHDIRRLETNLKLQEERIAEMMTELDVVGSQKEAMVEDCAEAREARDKAIQERELAEMEVERMEEQTECLTGGHHVELMTMVDLLSQAVSHSRQTTARLQQLVSRSLKTEDDAAKKISMLDATNTQLSEAMDQLNIEKQDIAARLTLMTSSLANNANVSRIHDVENRDLTIAFAAVQLALRESTRKRDALHKTTLSLQTQVSELRDELGLKMVEAQSSKEELQALQAQHSTLSSQLDSTAVEHRTQMQELEERLKEQGLQHTKALDVLTSTRNALEGQLGEAMNHAPHTGKSEELIDLEARLALANQQLLQTQERYETTARRLCQVEEEASRTTNDLQIHLDAVTSKLETQRELDAELAQVRADHSKELSSLQEELAVTRTDLADATQAIAKLEGLYQDAQTELVQNRQESAERSSLINEKHQKDLTALEDKLAHESQALHIRTEESAREFEELHSQLQMEIEARKCDQDEFNTRLETNAARLIEADRLLLNVRETLSDTQSELQHREDEIVGLQEEKRSLQTEVTAIRAEMQRLASLTRFLENQVKESETTSSSLKTALEQMRLNLAQSEKSGKAAEINLALQAAQHEQIISALRRELTSIRSQPNLQDIVSDLEEKNQELDDLLKSKCAEIEDYDDRILDSLKANKKLNMKVEVLTRKVQALQTKLASTKSPLQPSPSNEVIAGRPSVALGKTLPQLPAESGPMTRSALIPTPNPSIMARSKTPDLKSPPVMNARTPERKEMWEVASTSAGIKRRAPDDDEREGIPPEGHYHVTDSNLHRAITPRSRKVTLASQSGFTPVRKSSSRTILGLPSPGRRATTSVTGEQVISDVTNSPRSASAQARALVSTSKRSWLGKIKGGAAQTANRGWSGHSERLEDGR